MTVIREHVYASGKCLHCGDLEAQNIDTGRACVGREVPRSVPESIFNKPWEIGERLKEIAKEENRINVT